MSQTDLVPADASHQHGLMLFHGTPDALHVQFNGLLDPNKALCDRGSICATPNLDMASLYTLGQRLVLVCFPEGNEFTPYAVITGDEHMPLQGFVYAFDAEKNNFRRHVWPNGGMSGEYRTQNIVPVSSPHTIINSFQRIAELNVVIFGLAQNSDRAEFLREWRASCDRKEFMRQQEQSRHIRQLTANAL